jgi:hypothetical protein
VNRAVIVSGVGLGLCGLLVAGVSSCQTDSRPPGDEVLGTYDFLTEGPTGTCAFPEIPLDAGLAFEVTLSRDSSGSPVWLTLGNVAREVGFDGGRVTSVFQARRLFSGCTCTPNLEETLDVVLLSRTQNEALAGACPVDPFDGGVPAPQPDVDGGIRGPGPGTQGYDAVRACGLLIDELLLPEGCTCDAGPCRLVYRTVGVKR